jgi:hypothetical protein
MAASQWILTPRQLMELRLGGPLRSSDLFPPASPLTPDQLTQRIVQAAQDVRRMGDISFQRLQVLAHYSHGTLRCAHCGDTRLNGLTLDHVNGDGKAHRQTVKGDFALWLYRQKFPASPPLQVLCATCNFIKARAEGRTRLRHRRKR